MTMEPRKLLERLRRAVDDHDIEALVDCFAPSYRNETPAHPGRSFEGAEQVRANWSRIFAGVPDVAAEVVRTAVDGDVVWSEWEMRGTRPDGAPHLMRGVIVFGVDASGRLRVVPLLPRAGRLRRGWRRCGSGPDRRGATVMTAVARDARPPEALIRVMNPVLRAVLPTPVGRLVRPFALLEFDGRCSGRRFRVPVGWHRTDSGDVVVTPAPWRANFRDGLQVTVHHRGVCRELIGTLVTEPTHVAAELQSLADRQGSLVRVGIKTPRGHTVTVEDVAAVDRAVIHFRHA